MQRLSPALIHVSDEINPNSTDSNRLYGLGMNANAGAVFREGGPIVANDVVGTWTLISTAYVSLHSICVKLMHRTRHLTTHLTRVPARPCPRVTTWKTCPPSAS